MIACLAYAYERRTERIPVYAAPPIVTEPPIDLSLVIDPNKVSLTGNCLFTLLCLSKNDGTGHDAITLSAL